jgi:hypothetical protein
VLATAVTCDVSGKNQSPAELQLPGTPPYAELALGLGRTVQAVIILRS